MKLPNTSAVGAWHCQAPTQTPYLIKLMLLNVVELALLALAIPSIRLILLEAG